MRPFYERLLAVLRQWQWQLLECVPAFDGNGSIDAFIACAWRGSDGERLVVAVNEKMIMQQPFHFLGLRRRAP